MAGRTGRQSPEYVMALRGLRHPQPAGDADVLLSERLLR